MKRFFFLRWGRWRLHGWRTRMKRWIGCGGSIWLQQDGSAGFEFEVLIWQINGWLYRDTGRTYPDLPEAPAKP